MRSAEFGIRNAECGVRSAEWREVPAPLPRVTAEPIRARPRTFLALVVVVPSLRADGPGPRKVIQINREEIKPGRTATHVKAEEAYVRAVHGAKAPLYWVGLRSMTGPPEAWFLASYDTYAAYEAENDMLAKNAGLGRQLDAADEQDAAFRTGGGSIIAELLENLSYRMRPTVQDMRYMTVVTFRIRPGFSQAFEEVRTLVKAAHEKANVDEHWAAYRVVSGMPAGTYLLLSGSTTLKDLDTDPHSQAYRDAVGDDGRAKQQQFQREGLIATDVATFEITPQMSSVPDEWTKARPDFWKAPAPAKTAAKPADAAKPGQ